MTLALVLAGVLCATSAAAQSVTLRYAPQEGVTVRRAFQIHTRVTVRDSAVRSRDVVELGGVREVSVRDAEGALVVHLAYDSLRVRVREAAGPWREVTAPASDAWVQARVDARHGLAPRATRGDGHASDRLTLVASGVPGLTLPAAPVRGGQRWSGTLPFGALRVLDEAAQLPALRVEAWVAVDSVVARAHDTLAYLSLEGRITAADAVGVADAVGGGVRAQLVWSTGWCAFVSAAVRSRLELRRRGAVVVVETTLRQQVRS